MSITGEERSISSQLTAGTANFKVSFNLFFKLTRNTFNPASGKIQIHKSARISHVPHA